MWRHSCAIFMLTSHQRRISAHTTDESFASSPFLCRFFPGKRCPVARIDRCLSGICSFYATFCFPNAASAIFERCWWRNSWFFCFKCHFRHFFAFFASCSTLTFLFAFSSQQYSLYSLRIDDEVSDRRRNLEIPTSRAYIPSTAWSLIYSASSVFSLTLLLRNLPRFHLNSALILGFQGKN